MKSSYAHLKVSVIIPVYNAEKYLKETLISVLNQTHTNLEIICINDGSTDNSLQILASYKDQILLINQSNQGQCAASNKGLEQATGEYIKFLDADDIINSQHIAHQLIRLEGRNDILASCAWGRFYNEYPLSAQFNPEPVWKDMEALDWIKTALNQQNEMMPGWLWLIPRKLIETTGGWDDKLSLNNDFEFSLRLLSKAKGVRFAAEAKAYYRSNNDQSLASTNTKEAYLAALKSTELGFESIRTLDDSDEINLIEANRLQRWVYRMYPDYPDLVIQTEDKIKQLGGSNVKIEAGRLFKMMEPFLGWKYTKMIQLWLYNVGYKPKHPHQTDRANDQKHINSKNFRPSCF
jgi:glycosyltransferase involved in cell wall biosynthesis